MPDEALNRFRSFERIKNTFKKYEVRALVKAVLDDERGFFGVKFVSTDG